MRTRVFRVENTTSGRVVTEATKIRLVAPKRARRLVPFTMADAVVTRGADGAVQLLLPEPPSSNRYWRVYRGRAVKSAEARAYQAAVAILARDVRVEGEVGVRVNWWRRTRAGDLDNRLKCLLDALKGLVYADDKQVARIVAERHDGPYDGRVVVEVSALVRDALR